MLKPSSRLSQGSALAVSRVPANRVRQFARAAGILAKSDQIDAAVLVRFGAAMQPASTPAQPAHIACLRELDAGAPSLRLDCSVQNKIGSPNYAAQSCVPCIAT